MCYREIHLFIFHSLAYVHSLNLFVAKYAMNIVTCIREEKSGEWNIILIGSWSKRTWPRVNEAWPRACGASGLYSLVTDLIQHRSPPPPLLPPRTIKNALPMNYHRVRLRIGLYSPPFEQTAPEFHSYTIMINFFSQFRNKIAAQFSAKTDYRITSARTQCKSCWETDVWAPAVDW